MKTFRLLLPLALLSTMAPAESVKDREAAVRKDRTTMENDARWIYGDVARGFAEARRTGRPLLVVLRCVPCQACMGIDASVLSEPALGPLLERFVCVRVIDANALDLALFQFDYDLSFSTLFFAADGTVLGRYGSWTHQKDARDSTTAGFRRALEAALALHREYPANKAALAGKQGGPTPFKTPVEIPALAGKYRRELDWDGKVVQSCVHCHQIGEAFRASLRDKGQAIPTELIYPMPAPETIGLALAADRIAHVDAVAPGSVAAAAGVRAGDDFISFAGQPLISIADVAWALHRAPDAGSIPAVVTRDGAPLELMFALPVGWRMKTDISGRAGTWSVRGMATGGLVLEDLGDAARAARNLGPERMALFVKGLGQFGKHAAAKNAGFQKNDVIVKLDGFTARIGEGELIGHLLGAHRPGEQVKATVLRGAESVELTLPMQ